MLKWCLSCHYFRLKNQDRGWHWVRAVHLFLGRAPFVMAKIPECAWSFLTPKSSCECSTPHSENSVNNQRPGDLGRSWLPGFFAPWPRYCCHQQRTQLLKYISTYMLWMNMEVGNRTYITQRLHPGIGSIAIREEWKQVTMKHYMDQYSWSMFGIR